MHGVRGLAEYVDAARRGDPPAEVRDAALRCILDLLSAVAVGFASPGSVATRKAAEAMFGAGTSPIWFAGRSISPIGAIWSNSAAASALDLDDGNRIARGHPGAAVIPAVLATAAETNASLDDIIKAIVVGYQVGVSVAAARGFYTATGMWCGYGVVAAVGLLRQTPVEQLCHAFAIAGMISPNVMHAAGVVRYSLDGNDVKEGIPWATVSGMTAVQLAESGFAGPLDILDHAPHHNAGTLLAQLAAGPHICNTYFKLYSCCRHIHAPIDALHELMAQHSLAPSDIDSIDVHTYGGALQISNRARPTNLGDVQFSIPYCLGLAATVGPSALLPLTDTALGQESATEFAQKVSLHLDPAIDGKFPAQSLARVAVSSGGRRYESPVTAPRGEASNPLSWQELTQKFEVATRLVMTAAQQNELLAAVDQLRQGNKCALADALSQNYFGD